MPMILSHGRNVLAALAVLVGFAGAVPALASCKINHSGFVAQDVRMDMGRIVIPPNLPVGSVIKELVVAMNSTEWHKTAYCTNGGSLIAEYVNSTQQKPVAGFSNVYETDVSGVGIRLSSDLGGGTLLYYPRVETINGSAYNYLGSSSFKIQLIKTAAQTGSGVIAPNGRFWVMYYNGDGASRPARTSSFNGGGTTVVSPTCEVQAGSRNIAVDFGSVPNTSFTGVGSKAVNRDFEIRLNCQGGNVAQYKVGIRLDADQDNSNMPGVLKLSPVSNSASRIGIQMVRRDGGTEREVRFGQAVDIGTTAPGTSIMTLPLRARYVQTRAGTVGVGVANGRATFTIQYE